MLGAEPGVVREDDPGVHVEARVGEGGGGLAVGLPGGPRPGRVRPQLTARPALVRGYSTAACSAVTMRWRGWRGVNARVEWYAEASVTCSTPSAAIRGAASGSPLTSQG